jgi:HK97 family phage portal protein
MDVFRTLLNRIGGALGGFFGVTPDISNARISPRRAIEYAPVWYAVNKVAGHFSQLPINCHKRLDRGSTIDRKHPGYRIVHTSPNPWQTAPEWKMQGAYNLLLLGNWRCAIVREGGRPMQLIPFNRPSASVWFEGVRYHGSTVCKEEPLAKALGLTEDGTQFWLKDEDVFYVHGLSLDGLEGINPSAVMSNSLDAGLSAEDQVRMLAKKGFSGSLMLEAPAGMFRNAEEAKQFLEMFREAHDGAENTGKTAMLREGIKANMITMSGRDSQWIEQRLFQRQEAAMWFCLEEILGDDSSVSYNSLAEKHLAYLTNCLNRWLVHIEAALDRSLLTERQIDNQSHFFKFNTKALMRMDPLKQAEYLGKLIAATVISPNEARETLDMNPYEGGDSYNNPAITVADSGENDAESDESGDETTTETTENDAKSGAESAKRAAIVSRLRHLIGIEQQRVGQAMKTKNPINSLDRFYGKWAESLGTVCQELGGDAEHAAEHCRQSQDDIITLMQAADKDSVVDAVAEMTATWTERAEDLADKVLFNAV